MNPATPVTYTNYLRSPSHSSNELEGSTWDCPKDSQWLLEDSELRVEMRWNGNPVRPPVGIKAEQCSHQWIRRFYMTTSGGGSIVPGPWELEPRKPKVMRFEGEDLELS